MRVIKPHPWNTVPCLGCGHDIAYFKSGGHRHLVSVLDTCMCDRGDEQPGGAVDRLAKITEDEA